MMDAETCIKLSETLTERVGIKRVPGGDKEWADALLALMRHDGLLAAAVPAEFGGMELGVGDVAKITFNIARQSGSAGLIYAMHMSQVFSVVRHGKGGFFENFQRRMVEEQILIASGTSEKGPGGDIFKSICTVEEQPGGAFSVTKESPNISYVDHAGAILVTASRQPKKGKPQQVLILAEAEKTKFTPGRDTSFMGMRGILNRPWTLTTEFETDAEFEEAFAVISRTTMVPTIHIFWASLWSGLAASALDKAKKFVATDHHGDAEATAVVEYELTRLITEHHTMNALIKAAIAEYENSDAGEFGFSQAGRINRLKVTASRMVVEICQGAMSVIGIRAYATGGPYTLSEELSDALSAPLMVSNFRLAMNTARIERFIDETI